MESIKRIYFYVEKIWFKQPQKLRFLLVGGFNTVFAYFLLNFLNIALSLLWTEKSEVLIANMALLIQYIITINVSFITMRYYVFQSHGNIMKEWLKAWSVYIFIYLINAPVLTFFISYLNLSVWLAQGIYLVLSTILTFILHKYYSFKQSNHPEQGL